MNITVEQLPVADFMPVPVSGCAPLSVQFQNNSTPGVSCIWDFGNGSTSAQFNPSVVFQSEGVYAVTLEVTTPLGCKNTSTYSNAVVVHPKPVAGFSYTLPDESGLANEVQFSDLSMGAAAWLWHFGDVSNGSSIEQNPVYSYENSGSFIVCQRVENEFFCADTLCQEVILIPFSSVYVPSAFSPFNGDGVNDVFNVQGNGIESMNLLIFDRWGELIFETNSMDEGWDGTYKGEPAELEVYTWVLFYQLNTDLKYKTFGKVLLLK